MIGRGHAIAHILKLKPDLLNVAGHCGLNPVHLSCVWGTKEAAEALLNCGANLSEPDENGITARDVAIQHGNHEFAEFIDDLGESVWLF